MSRAGAVWSALRSRFEQRLSWKLAYSHLKVVVIAQCINVVGFGLIMVVAGQSTAPSGSTGGSWVVILTVFGVLFLLVTVVSSVVAAAVGVSLARRFADRLHTLSDATETIIRGDLSARVMVGAPDEIGQIALRFNLLTQRLADIDRARRTFVSNISHELRTPLAIIRAHVEAQLGGDGVVPPGVLKTLEREAHTLGRLIDELFDLSRIEEAGLPVQPQPIHARTAVEAAVGGIRPLAAQHGHITVESMLPADLPPVLADPTRLGQILNNLLYNALRHTPDGGIIVVGGQALPGGMVELSVSDTGVGIAPDDLPHIFDRHFHGHNSRSIGGGGLGLAIVRQLVDAQHGTVRAESALGQGTTITLTLPCA